MEKKKRILNLIILVAVSACLIAGCVKLVDSVKNSVTGEETETTTSSTTLKSDSEKTKKSTSTSKTTTTEAKETEASKETTTEKKTTPTKKTTTTKRVTSTQVYNADREAYLNSIKGKKKLIAFTFDDGPGKSSTNKLLDSLNNYNARVTFFVMGDRVATYASTIKRAYEMGNEIGSHTYSHKNLTKISGDELRQEINKTNKAIEKVIGVHPGVTRPPYGSYNDSVKNAVGTPLILWNVDTLDWKSRNAQKVCNHIVSHAHDGAIVLMHDIYETSVDGAIMAMDILQHEGYAFVTVSEMAALKGKTLSDGTVYTSIK